jgi:DNA-binding MarR family transcriptional regulator
VDPLRNFGFLLRNVSRLYAANFERHATGLNLTLKQCRVLCYLERNEGISQARLAELSDTDPMTLVRILDRMESEGLVERRADPADRRARRLHLRAPALPVLKEIWRVSDRARAQCFARMPVADRDLLLNLLQQMQTNLQVLVPEEADASRTVRSASRAVTQRTALPPARRTARAHAHAKA